MSAAFTGKVAFVTEADCGIGRSTAVAFGRTGAGNALADRSSNGLRETARPIEEPLIQAAPVPLAPPHLSARRDNPT